MRNRGAYILRENTGTSGLELTLRAAVAILAHHNEPHLVAGGLAVQEHGYFRATTDVDIIVLDPTDALEILTADLSAPFTRYKGCEDTVEDKRNGVLVNLLPAGRCYHPQGKFPFPSPDAVSDQPEFVTLEQLIALKLDSWSNAKLRRLKDKADVIELIKELRLPRDLKIDAAILPLYHQTWDELKSDIPDPREGKY